MMKCLFFLCFMKDVEILETELVERIYKLFLKKYDGNKSSFARESNCTETTIRRILKSEQGITVNLLMRIAYALDTSSSELLKDLNINGK